MIKIELDSAATDAALKRLSDLLDSPSQMMSDIAEHLFRSTKDRIGNGGPAPDGTPYAPKSPVTIQQYLHSSRNPDLRPLNRSGELRNVRLHPDHGDDWAEIATSAVYGAVMQFGASKGAFLRAHQTRRADSVGRHSSATIHWTVQRR